MSLLCKTVYAIQHNKTKRIYIGSSDRLVWRINDHLKKLRNGKHSNELMQKDYNEYGEDYGFYELDFIPIFLHKEREFFWMAFFGTYDKDKGYNYKDQTSKNIKVSDFPSIDLEWIKPVKNRDMLSCFEKTAKYLGYGLDELMALKKDTKS